MPEKIPPGFIDIHCHLLPGLDDGPAVMAESLAMARRYHALGVGCVVATPHWYRSSGWAASPEQIIRAAAETEEECARAGLPLRVLPGMEIGGADRLTPAQLATEVLPLAGSGYYLIEFPLAAAVADVEQYLLALRDGSRQLRVVLAHPERCAAFIDNDAALPSLLALGALVQMNTGSLLGDFGPQVQRRALNMLAGGQVHFLATDAHGEGKRMPPDAGEWQRLTDYLGPQTVGLACDDNPRHLLSGRDVVPLPVDGERLDKYFPGYHTNNEINTLTGRSSFGRRLRRLFRH